MKMKDTNEKQPEETDQQSYTDSQPETAICIYGLKEKIRA